MKEPPHTCPDINRLQKSLREWSKDAEYWAKQTADDDILSFLSSLAYNLYCISSNELEELRSDNENLREWGHAIEEEKNSYIEQLEQEIEKLHERD